MRMRYLLTSILSIVLIVSPVLYGVKTVFAESIELAEPTDTVTYDIVFNKEQSPYHIYEPMFFTTGTRYTRLVFEPGVEVIFHQDGSIYSSIPVYAVGSKDEPIIFRSYDASDMVGQFNLEVEDASGVGDTGDATTGLSTFKDVYFENMSQSIYMTLGQAYFERVSVKGGNQGFIFDNSKATIKNSVFDGGRDDAISLYAGSEVYFASSSITDNRRGVAFSLYSGSRAEVFSSYLDGGRSGIEVYGSPLSPSYMKVSQSHIANFRSDGLYVDHNSIADVRNNWWGDSSGPYHETENPEGFGVSIYDDRGVGGDSGDSGSNRVGGIAAFTPWLSRDPWKKSKTFVFFIPGIQASRLYTDNKRLWEPLSSSDITSLFLNKDGSSVISGIYTKDVIEEITGLGVGKNIYKTWLNTLSDMQGAGDIVGYKVFTYDWRKDYEEIFTGTPIGTSIGNGTGTGLSTEVQSVMDQYPDASIIFITHSNGGLLLKDFLAYTKQNDPVLSERLYKASKAIVLVAVPQNGTPQALASLLHGDGLSFLGGFIMDNMLGREFAGTLPSSFNLLPNRFSFEPAPASPVPLIGFATSSLGAADFTASLDGGVKDFFGLTNFENGNIFWKGVVDDSILYPKKLDKDKLERADFVHQRIHDFFADFGDIPIYQIVGQDLPTINSFIYKSRPECRFGSLKQKLRICTPGLVLDHEPTFGDGDGVVVRESAEYLPKKTYYIDIKKYNAAYTNINRSHADLFEIPDVLSIINSLINDRDVVTGDIVSENINTGAQGVDYAGNYIKVAVHSPVYLNVFDSLGRHTGLVVDGLVSNKIYKVEQEIPNSQFYSFGEGQYIILPIPPILPMSSSPPSKSTPSASPYRIFINGNDFGEASLEIVYYKDFQETSSITFENIPIGIESEIGGGIGVVSTPGNGDAIVADLSYKPKSGQEEKTINPGSFTSSASSVGTSTIPSGYCLDIGTGDIRYEAR